MLPSLILIIFYSAHWRDDKSRNHRAMWSIFALLGNSSFSFYLWHYFIMTILSFNFSTNLWYVELILYLSLICIISALSHLFIEIPVKNWIVKNSRLK
jgi:peptidoglycan/LPS O-acetylase OafA/YrhL